MFLGIDQGTTGTTALVLSPSGQVKGRLTVPVQQFFPKPGWVEHDPGQIWKTIEKAVTGALKKARVSAKKIQCIGLTNQRETVSLFKGSEPLHRFIVWQDRRTASFCEKLMPKEDQIISRAGTPIDPYFSGSKIRWLLDHLKILNPSSEIKFRTIDSYLIHRMTGEDAIEATNASRTSLMNLKSLQWDDTLFSLYGIPRSIAPRIIRSQPEGLKTRGLKFLPDGIPLAGILGDQQAALYGQCAWEKGLGKITYGTGSFILLNCGETPLSSKHRLVTTVAAALRNSKTTYALEGSVFICGAWIQWLRDQLGLVASSKDSEKLAQKVATSDGVFVVPALTGYGAPLWNAHLRGSISGLTRGSSKSHIARASLEALAFQNRLLVDTMMADGKLSSTEWRVDGGAVENNLLMQIQSNVLGSRLFRPVNLEATATGAALLSAEACGYLSSQQIEKIWKLQKTFSPEANETDRLNQVYKDWCRLIEYRPN